MADNIITLTTDFGEGFYVAQMKGVILKINKNSKIIDITHKIKQHNIFEGALVISQIWKYFPKGAFHVGVVDPEVGSDRKSVIIKTDYCTFIGPDNGLFSLALKEQKVEKIIKIDEEKLKKISKMKLSKTFHGRDVFAPVAALISKGHKIKKFGKEIKKLGKIEIPKNEVISVDNFGNIITSLDERNFGIGQKIFLRYNKKKKLSARFVETFSQGKKREFLLLKGSHGFLELDMKEESAAKKLNAKVGDKIEILKVSKLNELLQRHFYLDLSVH